MRSPPTDAAHRTVPVPPPRTEIELLERARALAGRHLADVAAAMHRPLPPNLQRHKGWVGDLVERALGGTAGSEPEPDFPHLGIELKTIPVGTDGRPKESTHVCAVALYDNSERHWRESLVRRKLARVLWVPVEADTGRALAARRIGVATLWSPSPEQEQALQRDWEELMELITLGQADKITGRHGEVLQLRPKAASGSARTTATNTAGERCAALPRGFYLRPGFTAAILRENYAAPSLNLPSAGR